MFFENDIVVIICGRLVGVSERVFGRIGVVVKTLKDEDDGERYYHVKDVTGSEFSYYENELRFADFEEIAETFITLVKERI